MGRKSKTNKLEETEGIQCMEFLHMASTYKISNNALPNIQISPTRQSSSQPIKIFLVIMKYAHPTPAKSN